MELYLASPPDLSAQQGALDQSSMLVIADASPTASTGWSEAEQADYIPESTYIRVPGSRWVKKTVRKVRGK